MSRWDFWTWLSIGVLVCGSLGLFAWFLHDAARLFRGLPRRRRGDPD